MTLCPETPLPHPRALAHLGDAVYELWIREMAIGQSEKSKELHYYTTQRVNAKTQAKLLERVLPDLSEPMLSVVKRAQNMPVTTGRRSEQAVYRKATAFEALIGLWYLTEPENLSTRKNQVLHQLHMLMEEDAS